MKSIQVEAIKRSYPKGTRIRMIHMEDPRPIESGTLGTVDHVDDTGTIHVSWDNGRSLGLIPNEDEFVKIQEG